MIKTRPLVGFFVCRHLGLAGCNINYMKLSPALLILFIAICVYYLIVFIHYRNEKKSKGKKINESVANAMASKIASDAQQHRENREGYNYIKSKIDKEG